MRLGDLADVRMGFSFRGRVQHDPAGNVAVIQMKDIDDLNQVQLADAIRVTLPPEKRRHLVHEGDLIFSSRGRISNPAALVPPGIEPAILAAPMLLIRPYRVLPAYLQWFINSPSTQATLATLAKGTSVRMITTDAISDLEVPVPDLKRQHWFADIALLAQREQVIMTEIAQQRKRLIEGVLMQHTKNSR